MNDNAELLYLLARGRLVHPTVAPFAEHFQHPDVVAIAVRDLPSSICALACLRDVEDPNRDALLDIVEELSTGLFGSRNTPGQTGVRLLRPPVAQVRPA